MNCSPASSSWIALGVVTFQSHSGVRTYDEASCSNREKRGMHISMPGSARGLDFFLGLGIRRRTGDPAVPGTSRQ
jgi:hypothetical protein